MERRRSIAAAPVRSSVDAWKVVAKLIADTLERSPSIAAASVTDALTPLNGLGPALIAGGHLEQKGLVLVDVGLHVTILALTADAALDVEENLSPVPGGASATDNWTLYIPPSGPLEASITAAIKGSPHLSADAPPASAPAQKKEAQSASTPIDLDALRRLGGGR